MTEPPVEIEIVEPQYPALEFMARHGHAVAIVCAITTFLMWTFTARGGFMGPVGLLGGAVAALLVYFLARVFWDIARLVADTMIPK